MAQVKLLSMTITLTALIWATADSLVNEATTISISFKPVAETPASDLIIRETTPMQVFELQLSGPRQAIDDIQATAPLLIRLPIPDLPTGEHDWLLDRSVLKNRLVSKWSEFRRITIVDILPSTLRVQTDHWVEQEIDLTLGRLALAYDVNPQLSHSTVKVRMRESVFREFPLGQQLQLDISSEVERRLKDHVLGERAESEVSLDVRRFGSDALFTPTTVKVVATVKSQRSTEEISTVPILFAVSPGNLEHGLRPVARDGRPMVLETRTVSVTGSSEEVAKLVRGTTRIYGIIQLKSDDLENLGALKVVSPDFRLPPGVTLAAQPDPVEFKLIKVTGSKLEGG